MITFEAYQLMIRRKWRWAFIIFIVAIYALLQFLYLPEPDIVSIYSFLILLFNQHFFAMVLVPMLFLIIITDLLLQDQRTGYVQYTFVRNRSRLSWFMAKIIVLFLSAFVFVTTSFGVVIGIGMMANLPWGFDEFVIQLETPPAVSAISMFGLYIFTLSGFGSLVIFLSILWSHVVWVWVVGSTLALASYLIWFNMSQEWVAWLPTTQIMYFLHVPNNKFAPIDGFTMKWSITYTFMLFVGFGLINFSVVRKKMLIH
ncbi:ABC transporter permease [Paenibacillus popilliae]|uniref:ABC transporter permease n=1 Tax=Paenibacillus popilliae TaxID=78057 RepID=UPI0005A7D1BD|nr:ABC transporter permease [Paenibacillus popilliae]